MQSVTITFSLFINDLESYLNNSNYSGIRISGTNITCLLYADDLVVFSTNPICLQRLLDALSDYCNENDLTVNLDKSKTMVFRRGGYLAKTDWWCLQKRRLENVNRYNYLGMVFTPKGVWTAAQENMSGTGSRALFGLKRIFAKFGNMPISNMLQVFDGKVLPIITYGAELWGACPHDCSVRVYNNFHNYLLGLPHRSVNSIALGELGRPSLYYFTIIKQISYWLKVVNHKQDRYTSLCYNDQTILVNDDIPCWALNIKSILYSTGFGYIWEEQHVSNITSFLPIFKQRLLDIDRQDWISKINTFSSLRLYTNIKYENYLEPYTYLVDQFRQRRYLSKLRCGVLEIGVNEGRMRNVVYNQRICQFCDEGAIDDETHFVFICSFHNNLRLHTLPSILLNHTVPDHLKLNNLFLSNSKYDYINFARYIKLAMKDRHEHIIHRSTS